MIPVIEHSSLLVILYWLLMIPIAILVLVRVTAFWADDGPGTLFGAVRTIVVMALAVYLTFDISGYLFARMMQDPQLGIAFPPGYHYWNWIREPQSLKWHVLGYVPLIRYLPVMFALGFAVDWFSHAPSQSQSQPRAERGADGQGGA